jgi:exodeoxyribonuclease V beta subunit
VTARAVLPFDVCGPLPTGVTVLEASAGTGKTFTIAALVARHVAAGMPLERLLVITFTRMATGELRERVRDRLVTAERGLTRALAGVAPDPDDAVLRLLVDASPEERDRRRRLLKQALADFDAATIATTHGFCQHVLAQLGVAGDVDRDAAFLEDPRDLVDEVVDDLYVRRFHTTTHAPELTLAQARRIARIAVDNPLAPIEPADADRTTPPGMRRALAAAVRAEVAARKRRLRVLTYDDLLTRLRDTLADPHRGPAAAARLRERYHVALVDEFQDTDPIQWEIMRRAFGDDPDAPPGAARGDAALVLIGDPKQAIYAFRGADVYAYLDAADTATTRATLGVNWRSDQGLIDAYDALFSGTRLGHEGIAYRTVHAADANQAPRLAGAPDDTPLRLRVVLRDGSVPLTAKGFVSNAAGRERIAADLAADVVALLSSGATVRDRVGDDGERVRPGHLAVLVRTHKQAALVRDALDAAGVPAVINGAGSVFATPSALDWLRLLESLERPAAAPRAHAAALTSFLGWTAERVALAAEDAWADVHAQLHRWADLLRRRGVASLLEAITATEGLPARVLQRRDGERQLTDLRHIGQLLHAAATGEELGVTALTGWLRRRVAEAAQDTASEERSRRLDSDVEAVQVLTIHRSKGLEFPIVYYPYLWEPTWVDDADPAVYHDAGTRTIDVGMGGPGFAEHRDRYVAEQRGEELRLAYVALTRAKHQAVVWWAGSWNSRQSALCRLLFARDDEGNVAMTADRPPDDADVLELFGALAAEVPGCVSVAVAGGAAPVRWVGDPPEVGALRTARFDRPLDLAWRRSSYSGITAGAHEARVASEAEEALLDDEPEATAGGVAAGLPDSDPGGGEAALLAVAMPLGAMPGGVDVGTFVHRVLEHTDFAASDLHAELALRSAEQRARWHVDVGDLQVLAAGLAAAVTTPLGLDAGSGSGSSASSGASSDGGLSAFAAGDRLDELWFELPLAGGDHPTGTVTVAAIADLLRAHLPADDPLAGYGDRLARAAPRLQPVLRGYLAGSLDLVLRSTGTDGVPRFTIVDHKTNRLGAAGEELTAWHYRPAALAEAMQRAHYPLQAILYCVALHRYLRWRLPGYAPDAHLGGVRYLFLRGMTGPDVPRVDGQPCGVFAWQPAPTLVTALSDLLDEGDPHE